MPETLFESALFGHERGAFTGATTRTTGLVEAASGGTLFLDELGDIPLSIQVKLLRLLETGTYRRVGSPELRKAEVRIVSATHRPLVDMVDGGLHRRRPTGCVATHTRATCVNCVTFSNVPACCAMVMKYICSICHSSWRRPGRCRDHPTVHRLQRATSRIAIRCHSKKRYATSKAAGKRSQLTLACQNGPFTVA